MLNTRFDALTPRSLLLTPNRRLCAHWRQLFEQHQQSKGCQVWEPPVMMPLSAWLAHEYTMALETRSTLLSSFESQVIWQSIIETDSSQSPIIQKAQTAHLAHQAYSTLRLWRLTLTAVSGEDNHEMRTFYRWATQF